MTELRNQINNIVQDHQECLVLAKSVGSSEVYEGTTATAEDIREGKTAYSNGKLIEGSLEVSDVNYEIQLSVPNMSTFANVFSKVSGEILGEIDFKGKTSGENIFYGNGNVKSLKNVKFKNTEQITSFMNAFYGCSKLTAIPEIDFSSCENVYNMLYGVQANLVELGGFKNLGKGYTVQKEKNTSYSLDLSQNSNLTHESLMNVINGLYDLNLTYNVANGGTLYRQQVYLRSDNLSKLTEDEIAIATNKGWILG